MPNQYHVKKIPTEDGASVICLLEGEAFVFNTSAIPARFQLITDLLYSTLEVAVAWGLLKHIPTQDTTTNTENAP